jgi:esterase/lipase superfamily enzyme
MRDGFWIMVVRDRSRCAAGVLAALLAVVVAGAARAEHEPTAGRGLPEPCPAGAAGIGDDVWVVSTRRLPDIRHMPTSVRPVVERHVPAAGAGFWMPAELDTLLADPQMPLCIFVHGNRYEAADARAQGLRLARNLAARHPAAPQARTVVLSWPSGRAQLPLRDGRLKYDRAHSDAHYLAWLLGQIEPTRPVAIVAYSFGTVIALEALEDLADAERRGRGDVQPWTDRPGRTHLVFVAAAVRCDALAPSGPYRRAVECVDRITLVLNSQDNALRFFPWIDRQLRADALGFVGMPRHWLPADVEFSATDAATIVGHKHGLTHYFASPALTGRIAAAVFDGLTP